MILTNNKHREDLTGIRGIAVLGVILFHAGFNFASGGYVGVDIFFVLSGFLVCNSIQSSFEKGNFSFLSFYLRRILRIIPAAISVAAIVGVIGLNILFPEEIKELSESILSFILLKSNIWASKSISYFGIGVNFKPLIHFWSLSIELQFYIIFPPLLIILLKYNRRYLLYFIFSCIFLSSLIYAGFWIENSPGKYYFSSLMRIWEFTSGVLTSLILFNKKKDPSNINFINFMVATGYLLIFSSIFILDERSHIPGFFALLPCTGTIIILVYGSQKSFITRFLSTKWLLFTGTISFSLYLIHQPVFAFNRILSGRDIEGLEVIASIFLSFTLGSLLYFFIERPFQQKSSSNKRSFYLIYVIILSLIIFAIASSYSKKPIAQYLLPKDVKQYLQYRYNNNPRIRECRTNNKIINPEKACLYGEKFNNKIALWGDSHADQLVFPLSQEFSKYNFSILEYAISGCPPITNSKSPTGRSKCTENSQKILDFLVSHKEIQHVILHAYWIGYFDEGLIYPNSDSINLQESYTQVIKTLLDAGKKIHIIYPVPKMKVNPPLYMARKALLKSHIKEYSVNIDKDEFKSQSVKAINFLNEATKNLDVNIIHISNFLFDPVQSVYISSKNNTILYRDDNHLSMAGAEYVAESIAESIAKNIFNKE